MKKLIFTIILVLYLMSSVAFGATYYVNSSTGANGNNGTAIGTPWKSPQYAGYMATSAGDIVNFTSTALNPFRERIYPTASGGVGSEITFQGTSSSDRAYFLGSLNVSNGATIPNYMKNNGDLEGWISSSQAWSWIETPGSGGSISREGTIVQEGTYSKKFVRVASFQTSQMILTLPGDTDVTLSWYHYEVNAGHFFYVMIRDIEGTDTYLQDDLTWTTDSHYMSGTNSNGAWLQDSINFTTNHTGTYWIIFLNNDNATTKYLDNVQINLQTPIVSWSVHDGSTYKITGVNADEPKIFSKSTTDNWNSLGVDALGIVEVAADLATCVATENTWFFELDGNVPTLYYHLASGETISGLHLEAGTNPIPNYQSLIKTDYSNIIIKNIRAFMSNGSGIVITTGTTGNLFEDIYYKLIWNQAVSGEGTATLNRLFFSYPGDAVVANTGSHITGYCIWVEYSYDDGFQIADGGHLTLYFFVALNNGREGSDGNLGVSFEGNGSYGELYNGSVYGSPYGIHINSNVGTANPKIIKNCAVWGSSQADFYYAIDDATNFTADYNIGTMSPYWKSHNGVNDLEDVNPLFVDAANGDFNLKPGSPCIDSGIDVNCASCTDLNGDVVTAANGSALPRYGGINIGAYENKQMGILP